MSDPLPISAIILSFNDELLIRPALESVWGLVGEIYVVDSGSTDRTLEIAREFTEDVTSHPFENYAAQRNWAQDNLPLAYEWVLHLDADERLTPELRQTLQMRFATDQLKTINGLLIARRTIFMGRWIKHGGHYPVYHMRIFRRGTGYCEERFYDQHFVVEGETLKITGDIVDTITTNLESWTMRHVRWANLEAQQLDNSTLFTDQVKADLRGTPIQQRRWVKNSIYYRSPVFFRAAWYFLYRYFLRLGFLDGTEGLIFHVLQGFWFRFYIDARLWELRNRINNSSP